jgi:hypothetical protein
MPDSASQPARRFRGLLIRREVWLPSWRLVLVLFLVFAGTGLLAIRGLCLFLSQNIRVGGTVLVMEGWPPDFVVEATVAEFRRGGYERILVTGGAIPKGRPLSEWKSYAEVGATTLRRLGVPADRVIPIPGGEVDRDRTFDSALELRHWMMGEGGIPPVVQVVTCGPHARRTRMMFQAALGPGTRVGMIAVPDPAYPAAHWWINSIGFRETIAETVAYTYARFWFHAPELKESTSGKSGSSVIR